MKKEVLNIEGKFVYDMKMEEWIEDLKKYGKISFVCLVDMILCVSSVSINSTV